MKRLLPILLTFILLIIGCKSNENRTVKIGIILPLTGDAAIFGKPMQNAITLFHSQYSAINGKIKFDLLFEDDQASPQKSISSFYKLKEEGCDLFIGTITSSTTLALAPIAEKERSILISPSSSSPKITKAGDYIFRVELSDELGARKQAQLLIQQISISDISILYINNDYGVGVRNSFCEEFRKLGKKVVSDLSFNPGDSDFRTQLLRIKNDVSSNILVVAQSEYVQIIRQITELAVKKQIFATPVFQDQRFIDDIGSTNVEGIIYSYYGTFSDETQSRDSTRFYGNYVTEYKTPPTYYSALAYDAISVLIRALENTSSNQVDSIKTSLYKIVNFTGVTGNLSFDENGDINKQVILKKVHNGQFVYL